MIRVERNQETPFPARMRPQHGGVQTEQQTGGRLTECGQDYQLHMSCHQGESRPQAGSDLVRRLAGNILFLSKEEEVT